MGWAWGGGGGLLLLSCTTHPYSPRAAGPPPLVPSPLGNSAPGRGGWHTRKEAGSRHVFITSGLRRQACH